VKRDSALRTAGAYTMLALLAFVFSGCDMLTTGNGAEVAEIVVDSNHLDVPVEVVTSRNFFFGFNETGTEQGIQFVTADTVAVDTPFEQSYNLAPTHMLVVRVQVPREVIEDVQDGDPFPVLFLRVFLDGSEVFNASQEIFDPLGYIEYYVMDG
jgi:hypothetical protein